MLSYIIYIVIGLSFAIFLIRDWCKNCYRKCDGDPFAGAGLLFGPVLWPLGIPCYIIIRIFIRKS